MSKGTKITIVTASALVVIVAVFAWLNRDYIAPRREAQAAGIFFVNAGGQELTVSMDDLLGLSPSDIIANFRSSGRAAEARIYQGVSLRDIVESLGIDYSGYSSVVFMAADGFASVLPISEAMDGNACYIAIALENVPLGTRERGGDGPFMMIKPHDIFSLRWCKYLLEVRFQ